MKAKWLLSIFIGLATLTSFAQAADMRCDRCGRITDIERINGHKSGTGGAVIGAVVGGLIGNQMGGGDGKKLTTVAGAVGGAYAGKRIAENSDDTEYRITVRLYNGRIEHITQDSTKGLSVGSTVRIKNGKVRAL